MSDDLVKRAREWNFCWPSRDIEMLVPAMADRIEELEGQLKTVLDRETSILRYYDAKLDAADAKLAVAVEALGIAAEWLDDYSAFTGNTYETTKSKTVRVAIAKIKGEQL
jgi:hypothetical protein